MWANIKWHRARPSPYIPSELYVCFLLTDCTAVDLTLLAWKQPFSKWQVVLITAHTEGRVALQSTLRWQPVDLHLEEFKQSWAFWNSICDAQRMGKKKTKRTVVRPSIFEIATLYFAISLPDLSLNVTTKLLIYIIFAFIYYLNELHYRHRPKLNTGNYHSQRSHPQSSF